MATPYPVSYATPSELRHTQWAMPHPSELRHTQWATPHPESYATPQWATSHLQWSTPHPVSYATPNELCHTQWATSHTDDKPLPWSPHIYRKERGYISLYARAVHTVYLGVSLLTGKTKIWIYIHSMCNMRTYVAYINFLFASSRGHADKKYSALYTRPSQGVQRLEF
jgi:hypothetical protein